MGLSTGMSVKAFTENIPVSHYAAISSFVERAADGEPNVVTEEPVIAFAKTSGSASMPKMLPVTRSALLARLRAGEALFHSLRQLAPAAEQNWLLVIGFQNPPPLMSTSGGYPWVPVTALGRMAGQWLPDAVHAGFEPKHFHHHGWPAVDTRDAAAATYAELRIALEAPLRALATLHGAAFLDWANRLVSHRESLIKDIRDGTFLGQPYKPPNPNRARQLEQCGPDFHPSKLWNLDVLCSWMTGPSEHHLRHIEARFGNKHRLALECGPSEGQLTISAVPHRMGAWLMTTDVLCEFFEPGTDPRRTGTQLCSEVEVGRDYEVLMTTSSGLVRYRIGDVYRVLEMNDGVPTLGFVERTDTVSIVGEKLTQQQVRDALVKLEQRLKRHVPRVCLIPLLDELSYRLVIETDHPFPEETPAMLDEALREANIHFKLKQETRLLKPTRMLCVPPGTFDAVRVKKTASLKTEQHKEELLHRNDAWLKFSSLSP